MKIAAAVEYRGTHYNGWQRLKSDPSVQQGVEDAVSMVANHPVTVTCAGRTDAGVHALYQVIHFETDADREMHSWVFGANSNLPDDVSLLWARPVDEEFHARFTALSRSYTYLILNRPARAGLFHPLLAWESRELDTDLMAQACTDLLGEHDFTSYRAQACQSHSPVRTISELEVQRVNDYVLVRIRANAFLYHMVRNIVGVLLAIGSGKQGPGWAAEVLEARDRSMAGVTAPPQGLYLTAVEYPVKYALPAPGGGLVGLPL